MLGTEAFGGVVAFGRRLAGRGTLAALVVLAAGAGALGEPLKGKIESALSQARLGGAHVGVSVLDLSTGQELVDINRGGGADEGFIPASNLKLFTSGAALLVLGRDYEFQTKVLAEGDPAKARIIVLGGGDPGFAEPRLLDDMRMGVDQFVDRLVESVKAGGVTGVREVVVDDRVFDRDYVHNDWPKEQLNRAYCAEVSGLNFHANVLNVYVSPGARAGSDPEVKVEPNGSWITLHKQARTVKEGNTEVWLERETPGGGIAADPFTFKLHGTVRAALVEPVQVTIDQPGLFFAHVFADRLHKAGLSAGTTIPARLAETDEVLTAEGVKPRTLTVVRTPLTTVLDRCNVDSDNLYAESLCKLAGRKVTGQSGTWGSGTAVVRMQVKDKLGADAAAALVLADGSGLSRNNRITPGVMTRWLRALANDPNCGQTFVGSLAVAGQEGTLKKRFRGAKLKNEIRAKSGYIRGVRTLSGYITNPATGKRVAFSVLVNNVPADGDARSKEFHEQVVEAVDEWLYERCKVASAEKHD